MFAFIYFAVRLFVALLFVCLFAFCLSLRLFVFLFAVVCFSLLFIYFFVLFISCANVAALLMFDGDHVTGVRAARVWTRAALTVVVVTQAVTVRVLSLCSYVATFV